MLTDVTVMVVTDLMVLVILVVNPDGRDIAVTLVMDILNNNLNSFLDFDCCAVKYNVPSVKPS